jgi:hypothetical protein
MLSVMPGRPRTLALGVWLASRGVLAVAGMVLAALGALASIGVAIVIARRGGHGAVQLPTIASAVIAWSAGVSLAFGAALRAIRRDRTDGIVALVRARGGSLGAYARGRVGGLVVILAIAVGGATLVAGVAAMSAAAPASASESGRAALAACAALVYALAFAAVVGPVAMAALGTRTRAGGYFSLLAVLVLPELLAPWTRALLPSGWGELASIPAALAAVRNGVAAPDLAGAPAARALAELLAVAALSLAVVRARSSPPEGEEP